MKRRRKKDSRNDNIFDQEPFNHPIAARIDNHNASSSEDDNLSDTSVDSLEVRLLEFKKDAAIECVERFDLRGAEEIVRDTLDTGLANDKIDRGMWQTTLAELLLWQEKAEKARKLVQKGRHDNLYTRHVRIRIEHALGNHDEAKKECTTFIKLTRKSHDAETRKQSLYGMYLMAKMAKILDSMGKKVDAAFYRSELPTSNHPWPRAPWMRKDAIEEQRTEEEQEEELSLRKSIFPKLKEIGFTVQDRGNQAVVVRRKHSCGDGPCCGDARMEALKIATQDSAYGLIAYLMKGAHHGKLKVADRISPLHLATIYNNPEVVKVFLEEGADANARDTD